MNTLIKKYLSLVASMMILLFSMMVHVNAGPLIRSSVSTTPLPKFVDVVTVQGKSCGIDEKGVLYLWGNISLFTPEGQVSGTVPTPMMRNVQSVSTDGNNIYIIKNDKTLWTVFSYLKQYDMPNVNLTKKADNVVDVKFSEGNVYFLKTDNSLWGWGLNEFRQLDMGINTNGYVYNVPLKILKKDVVSFSVSKYSLFAVTKNNELWSSGSDKFGQIGSDSPPSSEHPEGGFGGETLVMDDVKAVSSAISHTLILKTDNSVWAIGDNSYGQLGIGTRNKSYVPIKISENAASIATEDYRSAIIKQDGTLWTFGSNTNQKLGDGTNADRLMPVKVLDNVDRLINFQNALTTDGKLMGWGDNSKGFIGTGDTISPSQPVQIIDNVKDVYSSNNTTLVIKNNGSVYGWGDNSYGQVGVGYKSEAVMQPTLISGQHTLQTNITQESNVITNENIIKINDSNYFLIDSSGTLWGWGDNYNGALNDGTSSARTLAVPIANDIVKVIPYNLSSFILKTDNSLWFFNTQTRKYQKILENVKNFDEGGQFFYALTTDGKVYEISKTTNSLASSPVFKTDDVKSMHVAYYETFVIKNDQSLWSWGRNNNGSLGTGITTSSTIPTKVMDNIVSIDYSTGTIFAFTANNELWSWGSNNDSRLGANVTAQYSALPVKVMDDVKNAHFGNYYSFLITNDNSLWSWGKGSYPLGIDTTETHIKVPTKVLENVKSIGIGKWNASAIMLDGSLMLWGGGLNSTNARVPVSVANNVKSFTWNNFDSTPVGYLINENDELYRANLNYPNVTFTKLFDNVLSVYFAGNNRTSSYDYLKEKMYVILKDNSMWYWSKNDNTFSQPIKVTDNVRQLENDHLIYLDGRVKKVTFPKFDNTLTQHRIDELFDASIEMIDSNKTNIAMNSLQKKLLKLNYSPVDYDGTIIYKSYGSPDVASVDPNGLVTALKPGSINVKITNSTETITYQEVVIDIAPHAYLKGVEDKGLYDHDVCIEFDNAVVKLNDTEIINHYWVREEGYHNLKIIDNQNNSYEINFTIDKTPPVITLSPYETNLTSTNIKVDASTSDGTFIGPKTYTFTNNGSFTFWVMDLAGNISSKTVTINNLSTKPSAINVINVSSATTSKLSLNWEPSYIADPNLGPATYKIYYRRSWSYDWSYKISSTNSYSFTNLLNDWYQFYVVAVDKSGRESTPSDTTELFLYNNSSPAIPTGFKISHQSYNKAVVEWSPPKDDNRDLKGFVLSYQMVGSTTVVNKSFDKFTTKYELTGLLPNKSYTVKLRAYDSMNLYSGYTTTLTIKTQMDVAPKPVIGLISTIINDTSVGVKWTASSDLNLNLVKYVFEITDLSKDNSVEYQEVGWNNTNALLTGLELGHKYSIRIKTLDSTELSSEYSLPITVTTAPISAPEPVTGLLVTYQNSTKISVAWNPAVDVNQDVVKYTLYYTDYNDIMGWQPYDTTNTNSSGMPFWKFGWVIDGKTYWETRYWFWVEAVDSKGNRSIASERVLGTFVADAYPTTPTQLRVLRQGYSAVTLAWNPSTDANLNIKSYIVTYTKAGSTTVYTKVVSPTENGITITGLVNNAVYTFKVRALDTTSRYSGYSNAVSAKPQSDVAPAKVTGLKTTHQGNGIITYTWTKALDNNLNVKEYIIAIQDTSITDSPWVEYTVPVTTTTKTFEGLTNGNTYAVKIKAVDTTNLTSDYCLPVNGVPHVEVAPNQVNDLKVTYLSPNSVTLSWSVPNDDNLDLSSYVVAYGVDGNMTSTMTSNTNSVVITGLTNEVTYDFQVKAIDALNNASEYSTKVQGVPHLSAAPTAPSGLKLERQGNGQVELSWNPSTDINLNHKYYVITYTRSGYSTVYTVNVSPEQTKTTVSRLVNGAVYTFKIRSVDTTNLYSAYANSVVAKPQVDVAPTAIQGFKLDHQGDGTLSLSWLPSMDVNSNFNEYVVYLQDTTNPNNPWLEYHTTQTTLHITGLDNQTMYAVKMKAIDKTNLSTVVTPVVIGIPDVEQAPAPITNFKVGYQGAGKLIFTWDPVKDANLDMVVYRLNYRVVGSLDWITLTSNTNSFTLNGLTNGLSIEAQLQAEDKLGQISEWTSIVAGTPQPDVAPTAPSGLKLERQGNGLVELSWNPSTDINLNHKNYVITYTRSGYSTVYTVNVLQNVTKTTISRLVNGAVYTFKIRSVDTTNLYSAYANSVTAKPQVDVAPTAIQGFKLDHQGDGALALSWLPSTDANSNFLEYVVYLQDTTNPNNPWEEYHTTQTTLSITGLDNQTMYAVKMKAVDKTNLSTLVTPVVIGIPEVEQAPRPISNFKVAYQGPGKLNLSWDPVVDANLDLVHYRLYYRIVGSLEWTSLVVNTNTVNLTGLTNGVAIEAQLLAEDALGQQSELTSIITGLPQVDVAPTVSNLSLISKAAGTVSLGWTLADDLNLNIKQYEITYTRSGYSTIYKKIVVGSDNLKITGLVTGATYTFKIRALDTTGLYSPYSNSVVVKI